jgi:hypothetical protein
MLASGRDKRVGGLAAALGKCVDAERGADVGGRLRLGVLDLDAGCVRHPVDGVERRNNGSGVKQRGIAECRPNLPLRVRQPRIVGTQRGLGEGDQKRAVRNVAVPRLADNKAQIEVLALGFAARTEQVDMGGGSIKALVEDRDAPGDQLDLRVRDGAILLGEIPHGLAGQVLHLHKPEPLIRLLGNE